ncbi:MAG TPA: glycosyltransferase, partial [Thermodesulfovibrionales bacterium]|nr:glycosyltransferase [Thermodesulfovibrionales bacterium]
ILFYEKVEQTMECISSFLASGVPIYVLNNGSSRSARVVLGEFCAKYRQVAIIDSGTNLGVGVGRNRLISASTEEWLLFVDNDITITTHDWIEKIARHIERNPSVEVFIPRLYNVHDGSYVTHHEFALVNGTIEFKDIGGEESNCFPGGAVFVNRRLFERLGEYDDRMFVGLEDYEFAIRGIMKGGPVRARLIQDIELRHEHRRIKHERDRKAVLARYDVGSIEGSFRRIKEKHNVSMKGRWKLWAILESRRISRGDSLLSKIAYKGIDVYRGINLAFQKANLLYLKTLFSKRAVPRYSALYMTDKCNLKCRSCSRQTTGLKAGGEIGLGTVHRMVSLYPSVGSYCIAGYGEPTLCSDFVAVVDFLKMKRKYVGVITNGTNPDKFMQLRYAPDYISISLYGFDNESYAAYSGVAAFDQVVSSYRTLRTRYRNVGFSYITNRETYRSLERILLLCDDLKPKFVHLLNHLAYDPDNEEETKKVIAVKDKDIIRKIDDLCRGRKYVALKPYYTDFDNPRINCKSYNEVINLDGEGNIGGCQRKLPPDAQFGNIFGEEDPFNSPEMRRLRDKLKTGCYAHDECKTCFANWIK